ncbi:MAG TPA: NADH-quinone oxidoreductase subunit I [Chloroflexota bacterium]|jgi:NADH-quinone oxidoreductase subunit I|nr:NADH-quinone oxidoreductase subunit I [Chloroflexota bacterium]
MAKKDLPVVDVSAAAGPNDQPLVAAARTVAGMGVTLKHMVRSLGGKEHVTVQYPEQRKPYSRRFRGVHILTQREDGSLKCVACYLCATACPAECITIEAAESPRKDVEKVASRYEIDLARCIFCGFCVDACPEEALLMSREYDLTTPGRDEQLAYGVTKLTERPEIAAYGAGYRPHMQYPLVESYLPDQQPARDRPDEKPV